MRRIIIATVTIFIFLAALLVGQFALAEPAKAQTATPPTGSYNVKNYGAVGNGIQDDTNAIQAAINAVDPAAGGTVYVPSGVYIVRYNAQGGNTSLKLKSNMTFQMDAGAEIKLAANNSGWYQVLNVGNAQDVTITGGTITGDRASHTGATGEYGYGISVWNGKNITISGVKARDCWGDGFFVDGTNGTTTQNVTIQNCTGDNNRRQGLSICDLNGGTVTGSTFINTSGTSPQSGIDLEPYDAAQTVSNVTISGNTLRNNTGSGIATVGSSGSVNNITITGNTIESNDDHGMWIDSASYFTIENNTIQTNRRYGIDLMGCHGFDVHSNQVLNNGDNGIMLTQDWGTGLVKTNNCLVQKNSVTGNDRYGVGIWNGSYSNTVTNNTLTGNVSGTIGMWAEGAGNITAPNNTVNPLTHASSFYFAEGYTGDNFAEYLCIGNPNNTAATASVTYMFSDGTTKDASYNVSANSRYTVNVNNEVGPNKEVSIRVLSETANLVAERPMYFNYNGVWTGGSVAVGAASPAKNWYFAEGNTQEGFDQYVTVLNPGSAVANLTFHYMVEGQGEVPVSARVNPNTRATFKTRDQIGPGKNAGLFLESDQDVVVERSMYFNYQGLASNGWTGGHVVVGVNSPAKDWYFAEGTTRGGFEEWLCLQNPGSEPISVDATYMPGSGQGGPVGKSYTVPAQQRLTVSVNKELGPDKDVSVKLSSSSNFIAERPMYFDYQGVWDGGHDVLGATTPANTWFFADGYTGDNFEEWLCLQNPGNDVAKVTVTYYPTSGTPTNKQHTVPPNSRLTVNVNNDAGSNLEISTKVSSDNPIIAERPMYFAYQGAWTGGHDAVGYSL